MKTLTRSALALSGLLAAVTGQAQNIKPGLWEIQQKMQSSSGEMEQAMTRARDQMANMPPEQRKMVEEMMARNGVAMQPGGGGGAMTVRVCISREMAERNEVPAQDRGDCKTTMSPRVGNTQRMKFTCANPPSSGEGEWTFLGPEAYTMKMQTTTQVQGRPQTMNMDGSARWKSADCGNLRPVGSK